MNFPDEIKCDYAEITHYEVIPHVASKLRAQDYLEIGCASDACFKLVEAKNKVGVDPVSGGTHRMTSDDFFDQNNKKFDVIFVDGKHEYRQVVKDVDNALQILKPNGVIFMHDVLPANRYCAVPDKRMKPKGVVAWNGDVWRAAFDIAGRPDVVFHLVNCRHGVGIIQKKPNRDPLKLANSTWQDYLSNWNRLPSVSTLREIDQILKQD